MLFGAIGVVEEARRCTEAAAALATAGAPKHQSWFRTLHRQHRAPAMASRTTRRLVSRAVAAVSGGGLLARRSRGGGPGGGGSRGDALFHNRGAVVRVDATVGGGGGDGSDRPRTMSCGGLLRPHHALVGTPSLFLGAQHQRQQTRRVARETATAPDGTPAASADDDVNYVDADFFDLPPPSAPRSDQSYLHGMNDEQRAAILAPVAPMKVLAGPGSGKTRVLVGRVTHLINELGVPPSHILCITFTNKAAREMRERLQLSVGHENAAAITAGTFHSVACRMLRKHVHLLENFGRGNDFAIYDEADTRTLIRKILVDQFNEDKKKVDPGLAKGRISAAKSAVDHCVGLSGKRMAQALVESRPALMHDPSIVNAFPRLYDEYEANLRSANAMDFDDLLSATAALLQMSGEARQHYQQRWRHVLVDEFQDTSLSQYELIRVLSAPQNNVFVVGDVDQAIYSWRGAEVANIRTKFDDDFSGAGTVLLNKNYRSTSTIVKAAQAVISESNSRSPLKLDAVTPGGKDVAVVATEDEVEEAEFAAREAAKVARGSGIPLKDIAVLYRTHSQSRVLEEAFIRAGVPHVVVGDTAFYTRKEIKDAVAYLRVLLNPRDTVSLQRIINTPPRKIGPGTMEKLQAWSEGLPWVHGMPQPLGMALLQRSWAAPDEALEDDAVLPPAADMGLGTAAHRAVSEFVCVMRNLRGVMEVSNPGELIEETVRAVGFKAYVTDQENGEERWGFVKELVSIAKEPAPIMDVEGLEDEDGTIGGAPGGVGVGLEGLSAFLEGISLLMSAETRSEDEGADAVRLMTMHASKGLEFDTVFITGCEENLIPFKRDKGTGEREDEEVRLFYVGLTRAKRRLFLCRACKRQRFGNTINTYPSPFLEVIREALVGGGGGGGKGAGDGTEANGSAGAQRLAAHLAASGARVGTGRSFGGGRGGRFGGRGGGEYGGYGGRGGRGGRGRSGSGSGSGAKVEKFDPEAAARRAARRAAASKKAAAAAAAAAARRTASSGDAPRAVPRRVRKAPPRD